MHNFQTRFSDFNYTQFALISFKEDADYSVIIDLLSSIDDAAISFDRSVWAIASSGCVPPQLFDMNIGNEVNRIIILSQDSLDSLDSMVEKLSPFAASLEIETLEVEKVYGEIGECEFVEEGFEGGLYLTYIKTNDIEFELPDSVRVAKLSGSKYLILSEEVYGLDDKVSAQRQAITEGDYFYMPSKDQLNDLPEMLKDKEKIHLTQDVTGIRC